MKEKETVVKDSQQHNQQGGGYGVLSLMAMIVGIVIGSGIFAKNDGLITSAGSVLNVLIAWIFGALIVITLVIAFLEVISITEIAGEQSTLANWGRRLIGIRFGKFLGIYFALAYFPIVMAGLFQVGADSLLHTISYAVTPDHSATWYENLIKNNMAYSAAIVAVGFTLFLIIASINAVSVKPGKYFQNIGTMIKTIPLFLIILLFIAMLTSADGIHFATKDELAGIGIGLEDDKFSTAFKALMATMPAVLFSFDGFLIAGSLSKEGKKASSFRTAFILSIIFIIVIYILYSLSILGLGTTEDLTHGAYGSLSNAVYNTFDNGTTAAIVDSTITGIITISILTGASGCSIATYRMMADLSVNNFIKDENGEVLKKNKAGINMNGAIIVIGITALWFFVGTIFDSYVLDETVSGALGGTTVQISLFGMDMVIVWAYFIYAAVIVGAMVNRFTHKNLVNKRTLFWPAAIISVFFTIVVTLTFGKQILLPPGGDTSDKLWQAKILYTVVFFAYIIIIYVATGLKTGKLSGHTEVSEKLQAKADAGNKHAQELVAQIHAKNLLVAEYYGTTVEELEAQKQEIHEKVLAEKEARRLAHEHKHDHIDEDGSEDNAELSKKDKKAAKKGKEVEEATEQDSVEETTEPKKAAPVKKAAPKK